LNKITGTVEEIIFQNHDNGYTVCEINSDNAVHVAVGYIPYLAEGESVVLWGDWTKHPSYGPQFKVEKYEKQEPTDEENLQKYLSSGIIKGVGPATAGKIINLFGLGAIDIIENEPLKLSEIKGITKVKAKAIGETFREQREIRNAALFLQSFGISPVFAAKIYKVFGKNTVEEIKQNPYRLADEIIGIGFRKADKIATGLGLERASKHRLISGVKYVLNRATQNGHTYLPADELVKKSADLLNVSEKNIEDIIITMVMNDDIIDESLGSDDSNAVYLSSLYHSELEICKKLAFMNEIETKKAKNCEEEIAEYEKEENIILSEEQKEAVKAAVEENLLIITGGPGTGKTTIIKAIISILERKGSKLELAAPTGRAAKRMTEATGHDARTIHRMLEIGYMDESRELSFNRNAENPLDADIIIIDEMSMVDTILMGHFLKAVNPGTRLIMLGDIDQLPSVGPGNILKSLISCEKIKSIRLHYIFRQTGESNIITNAHKINTGERPVYNEKENDFFLMKRRNTKDILDTLIDICANRIPKKYNLDAVNDIQVLSPSRKGELGIHNLNSRLQTALNPKDKKKKEKEYRGYTFREGDKVMQIRNNYSICWHLHDNPGITGDGVFNGDMGRIIKISHEKEEITVRFDDDKTVDYHFDILDELEPSYAVTIHKSQGSEFRVVIIPVFNAPVMLLTRNILYTAITRARELVVLVGYEDIINYMIDNNREVIRYTGLHRKLESIL
jgi:exodeoxyribonuclease V alpha subunit